MRAASDSRRASRRALLMFPSTKFSDSYNQTKKNRPLQHSAPVTKTQVRAFRRPASDEWLGLTTTMWLSKGLNELQTSHPMHATLLSRLQDEPPSPSSRTASSSSPPSCDALEHSVTRFDQQPAEIRNLAYGCTLPEKVPMAPTLSSLEGEQQDFETEYIASGCPVLAGVSPDLTDEIQRMMRPFYQTSTFQFDLREEDGLDNLLRWLEQRQHEANAARAISVIHWTWYWSTSDFCWNFVADATILSLTSSGHVKLTRTSGTLDADACNCDMEKLISAQCSDWTMNQIWTMSDFVKALRQDEELLTQALSKFVELIQTHDETFHAWRNGPKACRACGKSMIFLRTFDDVEWTSE